MWDEKVLLKHLDKYFDKTTKEEFLKDLKEADCLHLIEDAEEKPYKEGFEIRKIALYNPNYGNDRNCVCGHPYYRHFDGYENNSAVGCKYCWCGTFVEKNPDSFDEGKIIFTDIYKEVIEEGNMEKYIYKHAEEIRHGGTHELVSYFDEEKGKNFAVRLDVATDLKTPIFHVRGNSDDEYLQEFDYYEYAYRNFLEKLNG